MVEIQESLCNGLPRGEIECHQLAEEHESLIEKWWFGDRKAGKSLYDSLCMEQAKLCCPANHFGPNCKPCPGFPDNVCSGRGTCKGNGTRKGSGKCSCNEGYGGDNCERCGAGHYEVTKDGEESSKLPQCLPCDKSCLGHCRGPTPKDCEVCFSRPSRLFRTNFYVTIFSCSRYARKAIIGILNMVASTATSALSLATILVKGILFASMAMAHIIATVSRSFSFRFSTEAHYLFYKSALEKNHSPLPPSQ